MSRDKSEQLYQRLDDICARNGWRELTLEQKQTIESIRDYYLSVDTSKFPPLTEAQRAVIRALCRTHP